MMQSVKLWAFGAFLAYAIGFIPIPQFHAVPFSGFVLWCFIMRYSRKFFFASYPSSLLERFVKPKGITLITGASSGIGKAAAQTLLKLNKKVILSARSVDKLHDAVDSLPKEFHSNGSVQKLDLASFLSIKSFAKNVRDKGEPISTLILNAAYHGPYRLTEDGLEYTIAVTHLGHMLLVHELLPILAADCRIVVVASDLHRLYGNARLDDLNFIKKPEEYNAWGFAAYNHSKLCNVMFVKRLAKILQNTEMSIVATHPGTPVESDLMRANNFLSMAWFQWTLRALFFNTLARQADDGAQALLHAAFDERVRNGEYFENLQAVAPNPEAENVSHCEHLWAESCRLVGIPSKWNVSDQ